MHPSCQVGDKPTGERGGHHQSLEHKETGQSREAAAFFNQSRPLCGRFRANGTGLTEPGSDILIAVAVLRPLLRLVEPWSPTSDEATGLLRPVGAPQTRATRRSRPAPPGEADPLRPSGLPEKRG